MPIQEAIIKKLWRSGPCCLDDVVAYLPNLSWGEVFLAVDRMSPDGRCYFANWVAAGGRFVMAGPLSTFPNLSNRDPWHGQSQVCSE